MRRILSVVAAIYILLGIYFAVIWGYVGAFLNAVQALDLAGSLLSLLKCFIVVIGWLILQAHILPLP